MVVYITTNLINGKRYIGRDKRNNPNYLGSGVYLKRAIKKYGKENFVKEILEECSSMKDLILAEAYWLKLYNVANNQNFYNIINDAIGGVTYGFRGKKHSVESRKKIGDKSLGRKSYYTEYNKTKTEEKNHAFKGYVVCVSGKYAGEKKSAKEWCSLLNYDKSYFYKHLNGVRTGRDKYIVRTVRGNVFKREIDIK